MFALSLLQRLAVAAILCACAIFLSLWAVQ